MQISSQQLDTHGAQDFALPHTGILCSQTRPQHLQLSSSKHPLMCVDLCKRWWPCNPHPAAFALEAAWLQHLCLTLLILSALPGAEPPCAVWGDNPVPGGRGAGMGARLAQPHQQGRAAWSWAPLCPGRLDVLDHCSQHWPGLVRALPAPLHQMGAEGLPGSP